MFNLNELKHAVTLRDFNTSTENCDTTLVPCESTMLSSYSCIQSIDAISVSCISPFQENCINSLSLTPRSKELLIFSR